MLDKVVEGLDTNFDRVGLPQILGKSRKGISFVEWHGDGERPCLVRKSTVSRFHPAFVLDRPQ